MIKCTVGENTRRLAAISAKELGPLHNSITSGKGNLSGFIGELIVAKILGAERVNTYEYDLVLPDGKTVDVKTKQVGSEPRPHYECSIAAMNTQQECDYYAFVRLDPDTYVAWFIGLIPKDKYYEIAHLLQKGHAEPNGYVVRATCYNVSIEKVWELSEHDSYIRR